MSENNERPKPPARRAGGRTLGAAKKTTPPPPPPTAELTPEQFAAEQAAPQSEGHPAIYESQPQGPVAQAAHPAEVYAAVQPVPSVHSPQRPEQVVARAAEPPAPAAQSTQLIEQVPQAGPAQAASPTADVAVRPVVSPVPGGTAFPVRSGVPGFHQEQSTRPEAEPSEGTPWGQGPGRPKDIPETAVVLNQRIITRESLDSSVPAALKLKKRIKRFVLDNELDHLPIGDIVAVALDEWLTTRGF
ncbi:hypothetical protein ACIBMX_10055 [Streptomyces phaeochromogenes]|uniref:hypothetical protein n=1 Tax=Streptomyces phaeochromogenes TaxID=1923 RepID=UPI00340C5AB2